MKLKGWHIAAGLASLVVGYSACQKDAKPRRPAVGVKATPQEALCVTHGSLGTENGHLRIEDPTVRAVAPAARGDAAALKFTYGGPSEESVLLASGQLRRQLGLKLRAEDGCNLIYVMWRIEPEPGLEVSIKRNPGKHAHAECGAKGYTKVKAKRNRKVPALVAGDTHTLHAEIRGDELLAWVDNKLMWSGPLGDGAADMTGPPGLRTDNVAADLDLLVAPAVTKELPACPGDEGDDD